MATDLGSMWGKAYLAVQYIKGLGVETDYDKAAYYFKDVLDEGLLDWDSKQKLDEIYDYTTKFKEEFPQYRKWEGIYKDYEKSEINLL